MLHACLVSILLYLSTLWGAFYMFSGTNLLTSCNSARCLFSAVFGFRKVSKEIFSELDGTNVKVKLLSVGNKESRGEPGRRSRGATHPQAQPQVGPRLARV